MRRYRAVAFDVDGVLTEIDSIWRFIHERLGTLGAARRYAEMYRRGEITYAEWARLDVGLWRGVPARRIEEIVAEVRLRRGAEDLARELKRRGFVLIALSAGLDVLTFSVARRLGFDMAEANRLVIRDGVVTGEVEVRVEHGNKGEVLLRLCRTAGLDPGEVIAVGDSEVDVPMFRVAGYSIAFNPISEEAARCADAVVRSDDLRRLLPVILGAGGG